MNTAVGYRTMPALWVSSGLLVLALLLAVGTNLVPRQRSLDIGAGDGSALRQGFHHPTSRDGRIGRVIDETAEVRLRGVGPYPAVIRITWRPEGSTEGVRLEATAGGAHATDQWRGLGTQVLELRVPEGTPGGDLVMTLRGTRPPVGTRIEGIALETGGVPALAAANWRQVAGTFLLIASMMAMTIAGFRLVVDMRRGLSVAAAAAAGCLTALVLVTLRFHLVHLVVPASMLVGVASATGLLVSHPPLASRLTALDRRVLAWVPRAVTFVILALGLSVALIGTGVFRGHVLSQTGLLYDFDPWRAYSTGTLDPGNRGLHDIPKLLYPGLIHAKQAISSGTLPLWSAALYGGHPFLASFKAPIFSPFTAIAFVLPLPQATIHIALAVLLVSGLGMFMLVRSWGFGWPASTFAGVAYLLNPFSVVWLEHPVAAVAAWMPWLLWATERVVRHRRAADSAVLAVMMALLLVCGHPETAFKVALLVGPFGLLRALGVRAWRSALALVALGYVGGALLSAVQMLPFLEYLEGSRQVMVRRTAGVNAHFAPFATSVTAFVPSFLGSPVDHTYVSVENRHGLKAVLFDHVIFPGAVTWLLAAVGLACAWRDLRVHLFAVAAVIAAAIMFGIPGLEMIPLFEITALPRFGLITIACVVLLAAFGMEALAGRRAGSGDPEADDHTPIPSGTHGVTPSVAAVAMASLALAVVALFLVEYDSWFGRGRPAGRALRYSLFEAAVLLMGLGLIISRARGRLAASVFAPAMLLLLAMDLLAFGRGFHPTIAPERVLATLPEIEAIRADPDVFRVGGRRHVLLPNTASAYGLHDFRGFDGIGPVRYGALLDPSLDLDGFLRVPGRPPPDYSDRFESPRVLDLLNVKYVFVEPDYRLPAHRFSRVHAGAAALYRNKSAFPRAFLVDGYRVADDETILRTIRTGDLDLRRTALLEADLPGDSRPDAAPHGEEPGTAAIRRYSDRVVEIETEAAGRRLLILGDVHYPGWKAYVDGRLTPIHRGNYALRAVAIPAGRHLVRFVYDPLSFVVGVALSLGTLLGFAVWVTIDWRRRASRL